jgi:UPF0271 protein
MDIALPELEAHILYQLGALDGMARRADHRITHMNPHGALGNLASVDENVANSLVRATQDFDPDIAFLVLPGSALEAAAQALGARTVRLFLADRGYLADGQLAPRTLPGAVIHDPVKVVERVMRVIETTTIDTVDGAIITMPVQSILVHSDTPGAVDLASRLNRSIKAKCGSITPLSQQRQFTESEL